MIPAGLIQYGPMMAIPAALTGLDDINGLLAEMGAKPCHAQRLIRLWVAAQSVHTRPSRPEHLLPRSLEAGLERIESRLNSIARVASSHSADDGALRLLLRLLLFLSL